jgi:hypothetical protein
VPFGGGLLFLFYLAGWGVPWRLWLATEFLPTLHPGK